MKLKIFLIATIIAGAIYIYNQPSTKPYDQKLFTNIANSTIQDLSLVFKQESEQIIKKLEVKGIKVLSSKQTILEVALLNAVESSKIVQIILE